MKSPELNSFINQGFNIQFSFINSHILNFETGGDRDKLNLIKIQKPWKQNYGDFHFLQFNSISLYLPGAEIQSQCKYETWSENRNVGALVISWSYHHALPNMRMLIMNNWKPQSWAGSNLSSELLKWCVI